MTQPEYFLIISLRRCGSTHLSFELNKEPDVFCDKEFVLRDPDRLRNNHIAIGDAGFRFCAAIDAIAGTAAPFRGSKVTIPEYQADDAQQIVGGIAKEKIKVVHLTRCLAHQMISLKAIEKTKVWHVIDGESGDASRPDWSHGAAGYITSHDHEPLGRGTLQLDSQEIDVFCRNAVAVDEAIASLATSHAYLRIDHGELDERRGDIIEFIATPNRQVCGKTPALTERVIRVPHETLVSNWTEIKEQFEVWETARQKFLTQEDASSFM